MVAVTVIVLSYRQARFLPEALASIDAQTYGDVEVLAMDDASGDGSAELLEAWLDHRPGRLVVHDTNQGVCRTLNEAYALAQGRYLTCLAADDAWLPEKLERQVAVFDQAPEKVAVVYGDAVRVDENGTELPDRFLAAHGITGKPPEGDVFARMVAGNFVPATTAMIRRSAAEAVGPFDESLAYEDWDYLLRLARDHDFAFFGYAGTRYRVTATSLTSQVADGALASHARIMRKCLGARAESDPLVLQRLEWMGRELARTGHPDAAGHLATVLRARPRPRTALHWARARYRAMSPPHE